MIPGLDAVFVPAKLRQWTQFSSVQNKLKSASALLSKLSGNSEDLLAFCALDSRQIIKDIDKAILVIHLLQVSIIEELERTYQFDDILSCSLGDIARNVYIGSLKQDHAIEMIWYFSNYRKLCLSGATASVKDGGSNNLSQVQTRWLEEQGFDLSFWSEKHATIAGSDVDLERVSLMGTKHNLKIKPVFPFPVHSKVLEPSLPPMLALKDKWPFENFNKKPYSSIWLKHLETKEEIFCEFMDCAIKPIRWLDSIENLSAQNINHYINVGPGSTLTSWFKTSPKYSGITVVESWDILGKSF